MIITTQLVVAVTCHQCGRWIRYPLSLFHFASGESETVRCTCGAKMLLGGRASQRLWIRLDCSVCDGTHFMTVPTKAIRHGELYSLLCPVTLMELGFVGPPDEVLELVESWEPDPDETPVEDWEAYFDNPEVMYEVLGYLHTMAEAGEFKCACGSSQIEMEIHPDRLELRCTQCGREETLLAIDEADLTQLQGRRVLREPRKQTGGSQSKNRRSHLFFPKR